MLKAQYRHRAIFASRCWTSRQCTPKITWCGMTADFGGRYFWRCGVEVRPHEPCPVILRFLREAAAAASLQHPLKQAARYIRQIAEAIDFAHQHSVVHRDIKPTNVLIDERDQARVTDFGLAKRIETDQKLTQTDQILGTVSYMSPEQAVGAAEQVGPPSDIYSIGAVLYGLLTGRPPFQGRTSPETLTSRLRTRPQAATATLGAVARLRCRLPRSAAGRAHASRPAQSFPHEALYPKLAILGRGTSWHGLTHQNAQFSARGRRLSRGTGIGRTAMNRQPYEKPPRWWSPKLSPRWMRFWRVFRMRDQRKVQRLVEVEVRGLESVREACAKGSGILITPNHASHADCFALYAASDQLGLPFYVMVAWQVFQRGNALHRLGLRHHGCFSIDREGTDMNAMRAARGILESAPYPLVIFPEGEVYHLNDRVTPFREGPAALALLAAKKGARPIVCIPCAMKYTYVQDPTCELLELMDRLERALLWRPRPDLKLPQRIYHLAEGLLGLKEVEYLGKTLSGPLPERIRTFIEFVLGRLELKCGLVRDGGSIPERIKIARKYLIDQLQEMPADAPARREFEDGLDDVFLVVQAFSYPGNYVSEQPTIERIAETLDKFEEDLLGVKTSTIRGTRKVTVTFGRPIAVAEQGGTKTAAGDLTRMLEHHVQTLLDQTVAETGRSVRTTTGSVERYGEAMSSEPHKEKSDENNSANGGLGRAGWVSGRAAGGFCSGRKQRDQ